MTRYNVELTSKLWAERRYVGDMISVKMWVFKEYTTRGYFDGFVEMFEYFHVTEQNISEIVFCDAQVLDDFISFIGNVHKYGEIAFVDDVHTFVPKQSGMINFLLDKYPELLV